MESDWECTARRDLVEQASLSINHRTQARDSAVGKVGRVVQSAQVSINQTVGQASKLDCSTNQRNFLMQTVVSRRSAEMDRKMTIKRHTLHWTSPKKWLSEGLLKWVTTIDHHRSTISSRLSWPARTTLSRCLPLGRELVASTSVTWLRHHSLTSCRSRTGPGLRRS